MILVNHEGSTSLDLSLNDCIPKLLSRNGLAGSSFLLILLVESIELVTIDIDKTRCLAGTEQGPLAIGLDTLHAEEHVSNG